MLQEGQKEARQSNRIEWRKNQKKKRRFAKMNRTEQDEQIYDKMQQRWMFDVLKEKKLAKVIISCCANIIVASSHLQLMFRLCEINRDTIPESLTEFRKRMTWEMFEADEDNLELLLALWRVKKNPEPVRATGSTSTRRA